LRGWQWTISRMTATMIMAIRNNGDTWHPSSPPSPTLPSLDDRPHPAPSLFSRPDSLMVLLSHRYKEKVVCYCESHDQALVLSRNDNPPTLSFLFPCLALLLAYSPLAPSFPPPLSSLWLAPCRSHLPAWRFHPPPVSLSLPGFPSVALTRPLSRSLPGWRQDHRLLAHGQGDVRRHVAPHPRQPHRRPR
jgi:hypothetical protein